MSKKTKRKNRKMKRKRETLRRKNLLKDTEKVVIMKK